MEREGQAARSHAEIACSSRCASRQKASHLNVSLSPSLLGGHALLQYRFHI